jgi:hypothetical protein
MAHLLEGETGYRSGSRYWARPGEPKPEYDPQRTTLTERLRHYADLRRALTHYARQLARDIDAGRPPAN